MVLADPFAHTVALFPSIGRIADVCVVLRFSVEEEEAADQAQFPFKGIPLCPECLVPTISPGMNKMDGVHVGAAVDAVDAGI